jgi:hypothetical protein
MMVDDISCHDWVLITGVPFIFISNT